MNSIQLLRQQPFNAIFLFFVRDGELKCSRYNNAPAPSSYPDNDAYPVYSGTISGFSVVQHATGMLECAIDNFKDILVLYSDDCGRTWQSKANDTEEV